MCQSFLYQNMAMMMIYPLAPVPTRKPKTKPANIMLVKHRVIYLKPSKVKGGFKTSVHRLTKQ